MKKYIVLLLILIMVPVFTQDIVLMEFYRAIEGENGNPDIPYGPPGPETILFGNRYVYIPEGIEKNLNVYDYNFDLVRKIDMSGLDAIYQATTLIQNNDILYGYSMYEDVLGAYNIETEEQLYRLRLFDTSLGERWRNRAYVLTENFICLFNRSGGIEIIENPTLNSNLNIQNVNWFDDIYEFSDGFNIYGISLDGGHLFIGNDLATNDYYNYIDYWMGYYNISNSSEYSEFESHEIQPLQRESTDFLTYIGVDSNGNVYYNYNYKSVYVFNDRGLCVKKINYQRYGLLPSVHPNGDLYFIKYGQDSLNLYRIPNTWAPFDWQPPVEDANTNSTATVTANGLRMRDNPATTNSNVVASLDQGTIVEILGQSATEETIGENTDFWYRVRTSEGLNGWVFGAFLNMEP